MQQVLHQSPCIQGVTRRTKRVTLRARRRQGCRVVPYEREIRAHFTPETAGPAENRHECEALHRHTVFVETGGVGTFTTCERVTRRYLSIGFHAQVKVELDLSTKGVQDMMWPRAHRDRGNEVLS